MGEVTVHVSEAACAWLRRVGRWVAVVALAAGAAALHAAGAASARPGSRELTLLVTSGLSGRLAEPDGRTVAALVATVQKLADRARARGRAVIVLDAGRTIAPYAESRFDEGSTMVRALAAAGCRAFAPDTLDLSLGHRALTRLAAGAPFPVLRPRLLPVALFEPGRDDGPLAATAVIDADEGLRVEVVSIVSPAFAGDLASAGFEAAAIAPAPTDARTGASGALRVAVVHSRGHGSDLASRALTWSLVEEPHGADLLIDPDLGRDLAMRADSGGRPVFLVGRERGGEPWTVAEIVLALDAEPPGWRPVTATLEVHEVDPQVQPDAALQATVEAAVRRFRAAYATPLPPWAPRTEEGLERFVLEAMRERAGAEVTVLNRGALRPVSPALFAGAEVPGEVLLRMLSLDQRLVGGTLSGKELAELAQQSARRIHADGTPRRDALRFFGLTFAVKGSGETATVENLLVNGRPLRAADPYSVATTSFLTTGGDVYPVLTKMEAEAIVGPTGDPLEVREDVVRPRLAGDSTPFPDLARRPLWRVGIDRLGVSFEGVRTDHGAAYGEVNDSRVRAVDSTSVLSEAMLHADQERSEWRWENRLHARYGVLDTSGTSLRETDDDLRLDASLLYTEAPLLGGGHPYGSVALDTEFRRNRDPEGRLLPRRLEESVAAGLGWSSGHWTRLRLGVVARRYATGGQPSRVGLMGEGAFLLKPEGRRPGLDARVLLESLRGDRSTVSRADVDVRLLLPFLGKLVFTPAVNYYLYDESELDGVAQYYRLSLGFSYSWERKWQEW